MVYRKFRLLNKNPRKIVAKEDAIWGIYAIPLAVMQKTGIVGDG
jgi:hypothetical protein